MALNRYQSPAVEVMRTTVTDGVTPLLDLLSRPVDSVAEIMMKADELANLRADNERLRNENRRLLGWQQAARRLEAENEGLRDLTRMTPDPRLSYITVRAVGDAGGAYVRSLLINAGGNQGVRKGQAAVTGDGLVGRVLQAGNRSARVLLITDINSRVPVVVGASRDRAILGGDNTNLPELMYLDPESVVNVGDLVFTSGHGGSLPVGIPVGRIERVGEADVRVQPFVDWGHMEYLRLIDYDMPERLDDVIKGTSQQADKVAGAVTGSATGSAIRKAGL